MKVSGHAADSMFRRENATTETAAALRTADACLCTQPISGTSALSLRKRGCVTWSVALSDSGSVG
jgi:hypothetical protein